MSRVEAESAVKVKFTMKTHLPDGSVKERPEEVREFVYGVERQVPTLEDALQGRKPGDRLTLQIPASEIYGEHDPSLVREIPKRGLVKQRLKEGQYYRQMKRGSLVSFRVLEIRPQSILADFNKPMAGIRAEIDLEVLEVRPADPEEIEAASDKEFRRNIGCG